LQEQIIIWYHELQLLVEQIVTLSGISHTAVYDILQLYDDFGTVVNPLALPPGQKRQLTHTDLVFVQGLLDACPTIYLDEIEESLSHQRDVHISLATLSCQLHHLCVTNKDIAHEALERDDLLRATWQGEISCFHSHQLVFLDEVGVDDHTGKRRRGWSVTGRACV
ncbi:hypothetical protein PAXRUDRAFT_90651, partial [Paxillus rubicundulus Ve08.2h10]